jgi:hypothetical protein
MKIQHLQEMPELVSDRDWNLSDPVENLRVAREILDNHPLLLHSYKSATLYHQEGNVGGQIGLISNKTNSLEYLCHYEKYQHPILGNCATQVKVWRSHYASEVGIATRVFDQHLLKQFSTLISDSRHTPRGREFWITQISGYVATHTVGILRYQDVSVFDAKDSDIKSWITRQCAWGRGRSFRNLRFFISNLLVNKVP